MGRGALTRAWALALLALATLLPGPATAFAQVEGVISSDMVEVEETGVVVYSGGPVEPEVRVVFGEDELERGRDYVLEFSDNVNAGTARVTISGRGDWTGEVTRSFAIAPASLSDASVTFASTPIPYLDASSLNPQVRVVVGTLALTPGDDYAVSFTLAGGTEVVATLTGLGNYAGTKVVYAPAVKGALVTFVDGVDGSVLSEQAVPVGTSAKVPETREHAGWKFAGWTASYANVREDLRVEATYVRSSKEPEAVERKAGDTATARVFELLDGGRAVVLTDAGSVLSSGWRVAGGQTYFAGERGVARAGVLEEDGKRYFLGADGTRQVGWVSDPTTGERLYVRPDDGTVAHSGWFNDGFGWYYALPDGTMYAGWLWVDDAWYWMRTERGRSYAQMAFGWNWVDGAWYWFESNGKMAKSRWVFWANAWYWLQDDGTMAHDAWLLDRTWYYLLGDGRQAIGWTWLGDGWYYFDVNDGLLVSCWTPDGGYVDRHGRWVA